MTKSSFIKKRCGFLLLLIVLLTWFSNSLQFRLSDEEIAANFADTDQPKVSYVFVGDRDIRYLQKDNGQPVTVIFVHGAPGSSSAFLDFFQIEELQAKVNMISIDRPGYGYSGFGDADPSLEHQADVIHTLVDRLGLEKVILVGHSLGTPIVAQAVFDEPTPFAGLVLVAGSVDPDLEAQEWYRPWFRNWLMELILPEPLFVANEEIYFLKDQLVRMEPNWRELSIPTILIQGEDDALVPMENVAFIEKRMSAENLEVWMEPKVNHFIPWNRPDLIVDSILKLEGKI